MGITKTEFLTQWTEPSDIFSVLLILGGDVIQLALTALTGHVITPVAFSFGWVAYAISALLSAIGENRLIQCPPEIPLLAINLKSGYARANQSWLLARLLKTYKYWMPEEVKTVLKNPRGFRDEEEARGLSASLSRDEKQLLRRQQGGSVALCVAVYRWSGVHKAGLPARDWVWWSGFAASAIQLGVSAIPFGLYGNWSVFLITACGTLLAYASGSLPQWRQEKWHARKQKKDVGLTLGNGSKHVVVVLGSDGSLDLEDLAGGWSVERLETRVSLFALAVLWLVLLVTSTGIKTHTWYLLAVGGIGMLQNLVVAGAPRHPKALGLPIELAKTRMSTVNGVQQPEVPAIFAEEKVMWTLMELEEKYEHFGRSLLKEFFPGKLHKWEEEWWGLSDAVERRDLLVDAQKEHQANVNKTKE